MIYLKACVLCVKHSSNSGLSFSPFVYLIHRLPQFLQIDTGNFAVKESQTKNMSICIYVEYL